MPRRKRTSVPVKSLETAMAAPFVIAHRLTQFAAAGSAPAARDYREFGLMWIEKMSAMQESFVAMNVELCKSRQRFMQMYWRSLMNPVAASNLAGDIGWEMHRHLERTVGAGIAPVHRRAVGNARRLGRKR